MCACSFPSASPIKWRCRPLKIQVKSTKLIAKFICQPKLILIAMVEENTSNESMTNFHELFNTLVASQAKLHEEFNTLSQKLKGKDTTTFLNDEVQGPQLTESEKKLKERLDQMDQLFQKISVEGRCHELPFSFSLPTSKSSTKIQDAKLGQVWWNRLPQSPFKDVHKGPPTLGSY